MVKSWFMFWIKQKYLLTKIQENWVGRPHFWGCWKSRIRTVPIKLGQLASDVCFVERTSPILCFRDLLPVACSAKLKSKYLNTKYQSGSCEDGLKLQNTTAVVTQPLSFNACIYFYKYKTPVSKIQHFRRRRLSNTPTEVCQYNACNLPG